MIAVVIIQMLAVGVCESGVCGLGQEAGEHEEGGYLDFAGIAAALLASQ